MPQLEPKCSFCGEPASKMRSLIGAPRGTFICNLCVKQCSEVVQRQEAIPLLTTEAVDTEFLYPQQLKEILDRHVIGQDPAKEALCVAVHQHLLRRQFQHQSGVALQKNNVLLVGPSGTGKTLLAETIARALNIPIAIYDATALTEAGYVGDNVESILHKLLQAAEYDVEKAEWGMVFLDEVDKKGKKGGPATATRDVSGEGVQQALLKLIEGTKVTLHTDARKQGQKEIREIATHNILFIASGAFVGLDEVVAHRIGADQSQLGFVKNPDRVRPATGSLLEQVMPEDLTSFGLIPEFVGRFPVITHTEPLTEEDLVRIQFEPANAVARQYEEIFRWMAVRLEVTPGAARAIAQHATRHKTGARGLRSAYELLLRKALFELPSRSDVEAVIVTEAAAQWLESPRSEEDPLRYVERSQISFGQPG